MEMAMKKEGLTGGGDDDWRGGHKRWRGRGQGMGREVGGGSTWAEGYVVGELVRDGRRSVVGPMDDSATL